MRLLQVAADGVLVLGCHVERRGTARVSGVRAFRDLIKGSSLNTPERSNARVKGPGEGQHGRLRNSSRGSQSQLIFVVGAGYQYIRAEILFPRKT